MFISDADLNTLLSETALIQVIGASSAKRKRAEKYAISEAASYLNFQYDTAAVFGFEVFDYDQTASYTPDQIILDHDATAHTCILAAPTGTVLSDTNYFSRDIDGRSDLVVMIVVDLLAYHLFSQTGANRIPEHTKDRYDAAIKKLKEIRAQKMNPGLPLLVQDENTPSSQKSNTVSIISQRKRNNFY